MGFMNNKKWRPKAKRKRRIQTMKRSSLQYRLFGFYFTQWLP